MHKLIIGCGYLGLRVADRWLAQRHEVAALTRRPARAAELRARGIEPIVGDVTVPESLASLPAAQTVLYAVGFDRNAGQSQREVYVDGLENVLKRLAAHPCRFLYISSTSVYGQRQGEWVDETSPCRPTRPNGRVCLDAEQTVWRYFPPDHPHKQRSANVLRLAGIYGPDRLLRRVEQVRAREPLPGNAEAFLNLIHVDDAVAAVLACEARGGPGETYLISDDKPVRRRDYYQLLSSLVGAPQPRFGSQAPKDGGAASLNKRCSNRKMHERLGVELAYPNINAGLKHALGQTGEA